MNTFVSDDEAECTERAVHLWKEEGLNDEAETIFHHALKLPIRCPVQRAKSLQMYSMFLINTPPTVESSTSGMYGRTKVLCHGNKE
eukprot:CAMPEP_0196594682 /NCGR_PEP_ID=MMETSP1081-20130531/78995_1 /TAXON_ID=36882 /ORGANISM="Pyramimonas amylifera, Strain CCMP720" /LENGTH=85 /DNA_ID=CAMNT_0041919007 /DNA_START=304 /DNA_END=561 /DNA_ORIENTATION=-